MCVLLVYQLVGSIVTAYFVRYLAVTRGHRIPGLNMSFHWEFLNEAFWSLAVNLKSCCLVNDLLTIM